MTGATMPKQDFKALIEAIQTRPTVPKYKAGRALGWGRRATKQAVLDGKMPVIEGPKAKESVPTAWLRRQLQIEET
jgi:hypothetical protein